jgi:pimeloyl-ACP methyl ester carboxylesterase
VAGGRLHLIEAGSQTDSPRPAVLLLHGASGSSADPMLALERRLAPRFRVIAPDRPGHGWSDRIAGAGARRRGRQRSSATCAIPGREPSRPI